MRLVFKSSTVALGLFFISCIYSFGQAPSNDLQANAISVDVLSYCNGISGTQFDLTNATGSNGEIDVWYKFVATTTNFQLSYPFNTSVKYAITSSDGYAFANGSLFTVSAVGKTYYIRFYSTGITSLQQTFCLASSVTNDESYTAIKIADGACVSNGQAFRNATRSSNALALDCYSGTDYTDIWYTFTASSTAYTVTANTNTALVFYVEVDDKDFNKIACGSGSVVSGGATATMNVTNLIPGNIYYVRVLKTTNNADYSMKVCTTPQVGTSYMTMTPIIKTYGDTPFNITAASSNTSGLITYSIISGSNYANITTDGKVTITGTGVVTIQAKQDASANYLETKITTTLTINKANLTITAENKTKNYGDANPALTLSYSGLVNNDVPGQAFVEPTLQTTVTNTTAPGSYDITFYAKPIAQNYNQIYQNGTLQINKAQSIINYAGALSGHKDESISYTISSNNPSAISIKVTNQTGSASNTLYSGNEYSLNLNSEGTVQLEFSVPETQYYIATTVTKQITIVQPLLYPTIVTNINSTYPIDTQPFVVSATSDSPGKITFDIPYYLNDTTIASITAAGLLKIKKYGSVTIEVFQEGTSQYSFNSVSIDITITKMQPNLVYTGVTSGYGGNNIQLSASSRSDAPIIYSIQNGTGSASISGNVLSLNQAGTATLTLNTAETANYLAAKVTQTINITQTLIPDLSAVVNNKFYGDGPFQISTTSNSTGAIQYIFPNNSIIDYDQSTGLMTIKSAGQVNLQIVQAASGQYSSVTLNKTINIFKKTLIVTPDNKIRNYNTENPLLTMKITGFVYGEDQSVLTSLPVLTTDATKTSNAAYYFITATGGSANNYSFNMNYGTLIVNKILDTIKYSGSTRVRVDSLVNLKVWSAQGSEIKYQISTDLGATIEDNYLGYTVNSNMSFKILSEGIVTINFYTPQTSLNYYSAFMSIQIKVLPPLDAIITFNDITKENGALPFNVKAISTLPDPISYSILSGGDFATITPDGLVTIIKPGIVIIEASQINAVSGEKERALSTLTITKKSPALTYNGQTKSMKGDDITLMSSTLSSGTISYALASASTSTLNGAILTLNGDVEITISVTEDADYMAQTITQAIHIESIPTSISGKNQIDNFANVLPNPFTDYLIIDLEKINSKTGTISLCDMQGRKIYVIADNEVFQKQYTLDTQSISTGMYLLQITTDDEVKSWKLIK